MLRCLTPKMMLISLALTVGAWGYLYVVLALCNAIWPAGGMK